MAKVASALLLCILAGCAATPPPGGYSICNTQPGSYECQVDRYLNVGM